MLKRSWHYLRQYQHLLLIILSLFLVLASSKLMMIRQLRPNASFWDYSHVYLGFVCLALSITFFIANISNGGWRQYFALFIGNVKQIGADIIGLKNKKLPVTGGSGLFSLIEGLGMLVLLATGITGAAWFWADASQALFWRDLHQELSHVFIGFLIVHSICALSHLSDFID